MKRITFLFALLALCIAPAIAEEEADTAPAEAAEPQTCNYKTADEQVSEWRESLPAQPVGHHIPDCPPTRDTCSTGTVTCGGNNACEADGQTTVSDTGLTQCRTSGGKLLKCKGGETVHLKSKQCSQCPCCSAQPFPCVCPNDCLEVSELSCR